MNPLWIGVGLHVLYVSQAADDNRLGFIKDQMDCVVMYVESQGMRPSRRIKFHADRAKLLRDSSAYSSAGGE